ncbi:MAG: DUF4214 domain-containing protein, partial [Pseudomonadales bacterium]|nr:DUF4214 domain-containing protein [Pseudomonadales bacterium]
MKRISKLAGALMCISALNAYADCEPTKSFSAEETSVINAYIAFYGRAPDEAGLKFWSEQLAENGGDLSGIIQEFGNSAEYTSNFGNLSSEALVNNLFQQAFGRDADAAGLAFYVGELESGAMSLQSIALAVLNGASGDDEVIVANRNAASQYYVTLAQDADVELDGQATRDVLATVTTSDETKTQACAVIADDVAEAEEVAAAEREAEQDTTGLSCDNGSPNTTPVKKTGQLKGVGGFAFSSEAIEGLGGIKKQVIGTTGAAGEYSYYEVCGKPSVVTFCLGVKKNCSVEQLPGGIEIEEMSIGTRVLGQIEATRLPITVRDVIRATYPEATQNEQNEVITNAYQLALTLDSDGDDTNGIQISAAARAEAELYADGIDFTFANFDINANVVSLIGAVAGVTALISENQATVFDARISGITDVVIGDDDEDEGLYPGKFIESGYRISERSTTYLDENQNNAGTETEEFTYDSMGKLKSSMATYTEMLDDDETYSKLEIVSQVAYSHDTQNRVSEWVSAFDENHYTLEGEKVAHATGQDEFKYEYEDFRNVVLREMSDSTETIGESVEVK